jgi:hypothetical protein
MRLCSQILPGDWLSDSNEKVLSLFRDWREPFKRTGVLACNVNCRGRIYNNTQLLTFCRDCRSITVWQYGRLSVQDLRDP